MRILFYFCGTNLKANHNKDYSVVKTFKAGQLAFFLYSYPTLHFVCLRLNCYICMINLRGTAKAV